MAKGKVVWTKRGVGHRCLMNGDGNSLNRTPDFCLADRPLCDFAVVPVQTKTETEKRAKKLFFGSPNLIAMKFELGKV